MQNNLVFQLGTNNWQRQGEFAPGSGILHEAHHNAFNDIDGAVAYSLYPSSTQASTNARVSVLSLQHDIPICESVSPVSAYRFHSMSDAEFLAYKETLKRATLQAIDAAEEREGVEVKLAIAHHCFLNPLVLSELNRERADRGHNRFSLMCFAHGTALKMFALEAQGSHPEYPSRFLPLLQEEGLFGEDSPVDFCAAISREQLKAFSAIFPDYDSSRLLLSPNGYDANTFKPNPELYAQRHRALAAMELPAGPIAASPKTLSADFDKLVVFTGKFADWKRLDALLEAAAGYERTSKTATVIIGSGPADAVSHYHQLAYEQLGLRNTWFLGPRSHDEIAQLNAMADVCVYPSRDEPFGLVFIEAMGCGTPVIGANSGGPRDFVDSSVGALVSEGENFSGRLGGTIQKALNEDWKSAKGPKAAGYAARTFSVDKQCGDLLNAVGL